jgi:phage gpG-like protein
MAILAAPSNTQNGNTMTFTPLGMAAKLAAVAIETEAAIGLVLEEAAVLVEDTAKNAMGGYSLGWPELQPETIARKSTGDSPLLETGELRDSIQHVVQGRSAHVGTNDDKAVWMEFGTSTIPPRSFIASAGMVCEGQIHEMAVETVGAALAGHSAASAIYHAARELGRQAQEGMDDLTHDEEGKER